MRIRCYSELKKIKTFKERYNYLRLNRQIGIATFGYDRYLNQVFYSLPKWKRVRHDVIIRDDGCDLGDPNYEINDTIYIHHLNEITKEAILREEDWLFDPEFLICASFQTHQAIHFGNESLLPKLPITRTRNDTIPWR